MLMQHKTHNADSLAGMHSLMYGKIVSNQRIEPWPGTRLHCWILQTNPWRREEQPQNTNRFMKSGRQIKATSSLFFTNMIVKLEEHNVKKKKKEKKHNVQT